MTDEQLTQEFLALHGLVEMVQHRAYRWNPESSIERQMVLKNIRLIKREIEGCLVITRGELRELSERLAARQLELDRERRKGEP